LSYSFNAPTTTYTNGGVSAGFTLTPTKANPSGHPAKNRGIYFDGTADGNIPIASLFLSHTFAVHTWVLLKDNTTVMNVFSKDRNDFTPSTDKNLLNLQVNASKKMSISLA
jgi:hypothetical protein